MRLLLCGRVRCALLLTLPAAAAAARRPATTSHGHASAPHPCPRSYLVQRVIPMLPRLLCEQLCSLQPGEPRCAFSIVWELDDGGNVLREWAGRSVIDSVAKLSYPMVQAMIDGAFDPAAWPGVTLHHGATWEQVRWPCVDTWPCHSHVVVPLHAWAPSVSAHACCASHHTSASHHTRCITPGACRVCLTSTLHADPAHPVACPTAATHSSGCPASRPTQSASHAHTRLLIFLLITHTCSLSPFSPSGHTRLARAARHRVAPARAPLRLWRAAPDQHPPLRRP